MQLTGDLLLFFFFFSGRQPEKILLWKESASQASQTPCHKQGTFQ